MGRITFAIENIKLFSFQQYDLISSVFIIKCAQQILSTIAILIISLVCCIFVYLFFLIIHDICDMKIIRNFETDNHVILHLNFVHLYPTTLSTLQASSLYHM